MPRKLATEKKRVIVKQERLNLNTVFNGKTIREAKDQLEKIRLKYNEEEFLLKCDIHLHHDWGTGFVVKVTRFESDNELATRLEKNRLAREKKADAAARKAIKDADKLAKIAEKKEKEELEKFLILHEKYKHRLKDGLL